MTPFLYSQEKLKQLLLMHPNASLFHWTNKEAFLEILKDKCIYSKGTLWGLKGRAPRRSSAVYDAKNGFIDYVFLGVSNWIEMRKPSYYDGFAIEFNLTVLEGREFFAFPLNTGFYWNRMALTQKFSDLNAFEMALSGEPKSKTSEFLLRRKVDISQDSIKAIHCPQEFVQEIQSLLLDNFPVKGYSQLNMEVYNKSKDMNFKIKIKDDLFTNGQWETIEEDRFFIDDNYIFVKSVDSFCMLTLVRRDKDLIDVANGEVVGQIIEIESLTTAA